MRKPGSRAVAGFDSSGSLFAQRARAPLINSIVLQRGLKHAIGRRGPKAKAGCPWQGSQRPESVLKVSPYGASRQFRAPR